MSLRFEPDMLPKGSLKIACQRSEQGSGGLIIGGHGGMQIADTTTPGASQYFPQHPHRQTLVTGLGRHGDLPDEKRALVIRQDITGDGPDDPPATFSNDGCRRKMRALQRAATQRLGITRR